MTPFGAKRDILGGVQLFTQPSLTRRALLAVILWAGFYLLAFGMSAGLFYIVYVAFTWKSGSPPFPLLVLGVGAGLGALMILWSSLPRWSRFKPPGPKLDLKEHPRLMEEIRRVARDTRQKPPAEVYLEFDANAWVSQRGGFLGLFTRRVLAIGLPLLKVLTVSQFRGVLAHEFGHYVGGDTRLGPWVYRTHAAIQRTLDTLEGNDSIWRFPFIAYARIFTRITLAISQRQELAADLLAARIAGARACAGALRLVEETSTSFPAFVNQELLPVLNAGFRPPLCEGFARFGAAKEVSRAVMRSVGRELSSRKRDPYRTHPPLHERLEAIARLAPGVELREDPAAIELVSNLDALERELLVSATANAKVRTLPPVAWEEAGEKAFLPAWRERAKAARPHLSGIVPRLFPELKLAEIGARLERGLSDSEARGAAIGALGMTLLVALHDQGWSLCADPGERPSLAQGDQRVEPFHVFFDLAEGKLTRDAWRARCEAGGFGDLDLGAEGVARGPESAEKKP